MRVRLYIASTGADRLRGLIGLAYINGFDSAAAATTTTASLNRE